MNGGLQDRSGLHGCRRGGTGRPVRERLAALAYRLFCATLFRTYRVEWLGPGVAEIDRRVAAGEPFVAAFWHYGVLLSPWFCRQRGGERWAAMVSASRDGGLIAAVLEDLGVETVRGSRNHLSTRAMKTFIRHMRRGCRAAIVADGSQGPARKAQPGAVVLAAHGRCPIVPMNWAADRYWRFSSWDRTVLPRPFARVVMCCGPPLHVPPRLAREEMERWRAVLEQGVDSCYTEAWRLVGRRAHDAAPPGGREGRSSGEEVER